MKATFFITIAVLGLCGCRHAMAPLDVRAELERREREWRAAINANYDLEALARFATQAIARHTVVAGLDVSTKALAETWSVGGATMKSGDWYFNAWEPESDRFSLHTHFWKEKKTLFFRCVRSSRTSFEVREVIVEAMRDELVI